MFLGETTGCVNRRQGLKKNGIEKQNKINEHFHIQFTDHGGVGEILILKMTFGKSQFDLMKILFGRKQVFCYLILIRRSPL